MQRLAVLTALWAGAALAAPQAGTGIVWLQVAVVPPGTTDSTQTVLAPQGVVSPAPVAPAAVPDNAGLTASPAAAEIVAAPAAAPVAPPVASRPIASSQPPPVPAAAPACSAAFANERVSITYQGGKADVPVRFSPPACAAAPVSNASWVHVSETGEAGRFHIVVDPNPESALREAALTAGGSQFTIAQAGGHGKGIAASPGALEFHLKAKKSKKAVLLVWSEDADLDFAVEPVPLAGWLQISATPAKKAMQNAVRFDVSVDTKGLAPGRHEMVIQIKAPGAVNSPLQVPVLLDIREK